MDFLVVFQIFLYVFSAFYFYVCLPVASFYALRQLIREWKKQMSYTHDLSKYAQEIDSFVCIECYKDKNLYKVWLHLVVYKDKLGGRKNISSLGSTIEDACYGLVMKAKRGFLENYMNDKSVEVI